MDFLSAGWLWLYLGVALMLAEVFAPGFVVFFFGLAAATVGALVLLLPDQFHPNLTWQLALYSFFSIVYIVTLRRYAKEIFLGDFGGDGKAGAMSDEFAGRFVKVVVAIRPGAEGRVELGDAEWNAVSDEPIEAGAEAKVVSRENLTLKVKRAE